MRKTSLVFAVLSVASVSMGAGFEKSTIQSGRYMGIGGAATSSVVGSESLFFNPAGLVNTNNNELVGNLSPTQVNFSAPNATANTSETSNKTVLPFGFFYSRSINDKVGIGVGSYVSGGNTTEYSRVGFSKFGGGEFDLKPDIYTRLSILEFSAGAGYRVNEKLRVGFAWRGGLAEIDQSGAAVTTNNTAIFNQEYKGLKGSNMWGYRLGVQYDVSDKWGIGASYRNAMHINAAGKLKVRAESVTPASEETGETDMSVATQFPQQLNLGTHYKCSDTWTTFFEYNWTNYGVIDRLLYKGTYTSAIAGGTQSLSEQYVGWNDQHNIRLAGEFTGWAAPLRLGYVYTSRVSSNNFATSTLAPPAPAHTLSLGSGYTMSENFKLDGAFDYTTIKGSVGANDPLNSTSSLQATTKEGSYDATVMTVHVGATYNF